MFSLTGVTGADGVMAMRLDEEGLKALVDALDGLSDAEDVATTAAIDTVRAALRTPEPREAPAETYRHVARATYAVSAAALIAAAIPLVSRSWNVAENVLLLLAPAATTAQRVRRADLPLMNRGDAAAAT